MLPHTSLALARREEAFGGQEALREQQDGTSEQAVCNIKPPFLGTHISHCFLDLRKGRNEL